jgi:hypothetical protein
MTKFPAPNNLTVAAIYAAYEATAENWDQFGINVGELGNECDRALWYSLRWASVLEEFDGRKLRLFATGNREEDRLTADLERAGVQVFGAQERIRFVAGHVRGKIDGRALGVIEDPKTEHLAEFKSSNTKNFKIITKGPIRETKPEHFVQCQLGMHALGLTRALYLIVNKDDETLHQELIAYDAEFCTNILARAERIVTAMRPPAKISEKSDYFKCGMCHHQAVCHFNQFPRVTCRSCIHVTPDLNGDARWSCERWDKPLGFDEQKAACPSHLFDPDFVPGEQLDVNEAEETITYRMPNGSIWKDGSHDADANA